MNIRDLNIGSNRPDPRRAGASDGARQAGGPTGAPRTSSAADSATAPQDRIEISEAARRALAQRQGGAGPDELGAAREALRSQSSAPLDSERKATLRQRVAEGYYGQDAVVEQVAERLAADLGGAAEARDA